MKVPLGISKNRYYETLSDQRKAGESEPSVTSISTRRRGRSLLLGSLDSDVQAYVRALRTARTPVNVQIVQTAAEGIVTACDRTLLVENGGHIISLSRGWALSLLQRMGYVKRKGTTQKSGKLTENEFLRRKSLFLKEISSLVHAHSIPCGLILNWDQTGISLVPSADYTMEQQGATGYKLHVWVIRAK